MNSRTLHVTVQTLVYMGSPIRLTCMMFNKYEDEIENMLDDIGYTMHDVMIDRRFDTVQQYKEWACWAYLEIEAARITEV